jgi:hypothetical protein
MDINFDELRAAIYSTVDERKRFRQLVVNSVMAIDIMDKDLKSLRNNRWAEAFYDDARGHKESKEDAVDRKATIVIEHLIQASDVSHTMQHWQIYRKWNTRLFSEMHKAYSEGRAEVNPADNWYKGDIGFFDFYIIPLAKKLKDCGAFGISGEEYLNYAEQNRREWESRGQQIVEEMVQSLQYKDPQLTAAPITLPNIPVQKSESARPARRLRDSTGVLGGTISIALYDRSSCATTAAGTSAKTAAECEDMGSRREIETTTVDDGFGV